MYKSNIFKCAVFGLGISSLILGGYEIYIDSLRAAMLSAGIGLILLLFTELDKVESFSFAGLKAKLKSTLAEAEELVYKLRELTILQTEMLISVNARLGMRKAMTRKERHEFIQKITEKLRGLGFKDEQIFHAQRDYYYMVSIQMVHEITVKVNAWLMEKREQLKLDRDEVLKQVVEGGGKPPEMNDNDFQNYLYSIRLDDSYVLNCIFDSPVDEHYRRLVDSVNKLSFITLAEKEFILKELGGYLENLESIGKGQGFAHLELWLDSKFPSV